MQERPFRAEWNQGVFVKLNGKSGTASARSISLARFLFEARRDRNQARPGATGAAYFAGAFDCAGSWPTVSWLYLARSTGEQ